MIELIRFFKALSDPTRLKILKLLTVDEWCVCELAGIMNLSSACISQHIQKLKIAEVLTERRQGQWVYYSADRRALDSRLREFADFLNSTLEDTPDLTQELERIKTLDRVQTIGACRRDKGATK